MYKLEDNVLSAEWSDLKFRDKKSIDENNKHVIIKELYTTDTIKKKIKPNLVSMAELDLLISVYVYPYIEGNSLNQHQIGILSALLELKELRNSNV